ncbi:MULTISPECIES: phosphotransferase [Mumia]|uniref:phosphotransferase n=1 Tax=Mumia TaxID=1546255 RepID=UPI0014206EA9|nr:MULTISPECIES: phosphotransferase [unclassified Mumia]QMW64881.1 phosphotransferase [Mumia sp. ZJ1417]
MRSHVTREGGTVVRPAGAWSEAVHALLRTLNAAGLAGVPEPLEIMPDGRERLTYLEGTVPAYPMPDWVWGDLALESTVELLRRAHDASASAPRSGPWRSPVRQPAEVICHNDFAPYNLVFDEGRAIGAIDWDFASPGPRVWDLAYLAYRIVPLSTADLGDGFTDRQRRRRLEKLARLYDPALEADEVSAMVPARLLELADLTAAAAERLGDAFLHDDAALYRRDTAHLSS